MRENRLYGSEGGGAEINRPCLPLSIYGSSRLSRSSVESSGYPRTS